MKTFLFKPTESKLFFFKLSFVVLATSERKPGKIVKIGRVSCLEPTGLGALFTACATWNNKAGGIGWPINQASISLLISYNYFIGSLLYQNLKLFNHIFFFKTIQRLHFWPRRYRWSLARCKTWWRWVSHLCARLRLKFLTCRWKFHKICLIFHQPRGLCISDLVKYRN